MNASKMISLILGAMTLLVVALLVQAVIETNTSESVQTNYTVTYVIGEGFFGPETETVYSYNEPVCIPVEGVGFSCESLGGPYKIAGTVVWETQGTYNGPQINWGRREEHYKMNPEEVLWFNSEVNLYDFEYGR